MLFFFSFLVNISFASHIFPRFVNVSVESSNSISRYWHFWFLDKSRHPEGNTNHISESKDSVAGMDTSSLDEKNETQTKVSRTNKERKRKLKSAGSKKLGD